MGRLLKERLAAGKLVRVFGLGQLLSPKFVEILGLHGGYDGVWFDHEHAGISVEQIEQAALAARAVGLDSFVRLAPTDYAAVMRPLEAGAGGIMAAQVRSAEEAERVVQWAKFAPRGQRGVNGLGVDGKYGLVAPRDYFAQSNRETFIAIQIEHADAVNDIERIAAVPDVDVLFVGPADLGQSMGLPGDWNHPRLWEAIEQVAAAARRNGIHWAIVAITPAYAQRCVDLGCRCLNIGFDCWALHDGIRSAKESFKQFFAD